MPGTPAGAVHDQPVVLENFPVDLYGLPGASVELKELVLLLPESLPQIFVCPQRASSMQRIADHLDTKREIYEAALSGESAKVLSDAKRKAIRHLNSRIEVLASLLRDLASLVQSYSQPTRPGELSGTKADLKALREGLTEVKEAIENLIEAIDETKKALMHGSRRTTQE